MNQIRNIAIIAHVDHGKTTLVDKILQNCNISNKDNSEVLMLDNNALERERGITILSKNVSVEYKGVKINIIDTPGHADFGGEVERVLNMADGVLLLVDAFEGPMPQTRFVLQKAINNKLKPIVVINKVDKENCRPTEVHEMVFDLMFSLDASEDQLDFPVVYGSAKNNWMSEDWRTQKEGIDYLMDVIIDKIPPYKAPEGSLQILVTALDYSTFTGKMAIGKISRGVIKENEMVTLGRSTEESKKLRVKELYEFKALGKAKINEAVAGDIVAIAGMENFNIGDTICDAENPDFLEAIEVEEPTVNMLFTINDSPFFGKDGKFLTSRHLRERLEKEIEKDLALRLQDTSSPEKIIVFGRGILHLSILIETMRREGFEIQIGQPQVVLKEIDGVKHEPSESLQIDVPSDSAGKMIEAVSQRNAKMEDIVHKDDRQILSFTIPSRGLIGLRTQLLNLSAGEAVINHRFKEFIPYTGDIDLKKNGALISLDTGQVLAYSLDKLQDRGVFFIEPGDEVYPGMVVGEHSRFSDLTCNVTKGKKLTNMRASGSDEKMRIAPPTRFSLEEAIEYIRKDEYLEVTPKVYRIRKINFKA